MSFASLRLQKLLEVPSIKKGQQPEIANTIVRNIGKTIYNKATIMHQQKSQFSQVLTGSSDEPGESSPNEARAKA